MPIPRALSRIRNGLWRLATGRGLRGHRAPQSSERPAIPRRSASEKLILRDLFDAEGTDKGWYADCYEILLRARRDKVANVLEIGIGTLVPQVKASMHGYAPDRYRPGGSLRAWRDYFPHAEIVGVDLQPDTQFTEDRISTLLCDSTDAAAVAALLASLPRFDVIVDDGSHAAQDQLDTLRNFFPALRPEGFYFIEDIGAHSPLFRNPALVEPMIDGAPYFAIGDSDGTDSWKLMVIQRMD